MPDEDESPIENTQPAQSRAPLRTTVLSAAISALLTGVVAIIGTHLYHEWQRTGLIYATAAGEALVHHKRIPILGLWFDEKPTGFFVLVILNEGGAKKENVRVVITNAGEVLLAQEDRKWLLKNDAGEFMSGLDFFAGRKELRFAIDALPPGGTFFCFLITDRSSSQAIPTCRVTSSETIGKHRPLTGALWASIEQMVNRIPIVKDLKPLEVK